MNENFLTYSIDEKITQYQIGNDLSRPGAIKPEVYEIYVGQPGLRGAKGDVGPQGNPGQAATITIGTVTSGSTPSVTNVGTSTNAVFDFVLEPGNDYVITSADYQAIANVVYGMLTDLSQGAY